MGKKYTMYTNTSNVLMVEYKGLMHLVVKLCDVNDDTHRCDLLVISPMTKILLGVDIRDFKCILNLQRRTCLDIYLYVDQIKKVLNTRGKSKVVIDSILTSLAKDVNFQYIKDYLTVLCLTKEYGTNDIERQVKYNTLLRLPTKILESYVNRVTSKGLTCLLDNKADFLYYKRNDLNEILCKYDFYVAEMSIKGGITRNRLQGCYVGKRDSNTGYHFSNISYSTIDDIEYDDVGIEHKYSRITKNNKELVEYDDLEDANDGSVLDDLYGNVGNIILLADLLYAINRYELGVEISFSDSYILALMGLRCELRTNVKHAR